MEEIKVNKDISDYEENFFFGLTGRQTLWGALALVSAALVYVLANKRFDDTLSGLLAMSAAFPFGAMAFFRWHKLSAFHAAVKIIRSILAPRYLLFRGSTIYMTGAAGTKERKPKKEKESEEKKRKEKNPSKKKEDREK